MMLFEQTETVNRHMMLCLRSPFWEALATKLYSALMLKAKLLLKLVIHLAPLNERRGEKTHVSKPDCSIFELYRTQY